MNPVAENLLLELICRIAPPRTGNRVVAFCYHQILPPDHDTRSPDRFTVYQNNLDAQLREIHRAGYQIINPDQIAGFDGKGVVITFDDNLATHLNYALPVLRAHGATATFFLNPALLGRDGEMDDQDVESLLAAGMVIGAHNAEHRIVAEMAADEFQRAVASCESFLDRFGMQQWWAYPGGYPGSFSTRQDDYLRGRGFTRFTTLEGDCRPDEPLELQSRYVLRINSSLSYLRAALDGKLRILAGLKLRKYAAAVRRAEQLGDAANAGESEAGGVHHVADAASVGRQP